MPLIDFNKFSASGPCLFWPFRISLGTKCFSRWPYAQSILWPQVSGLLFGLKCEIWNPFTQNMISCFDFCLWQVEGAKLCSAAVNFNYILPKVVPNLTEKDPWNDFKVCWIFPEIQILLESRKKLQVRRGLQQRVKETPLLHATMERYKDTKIRRCNVSAARKVKGIPDTSRIFTSSTVQFK